MNWRRIFKKDKKSRNLLWPKLNVGITYFNNAKDLYFDSKICNEQILDLCDKAIAYGVYEAFYLRGYVLFELKYYFAAIADFNEAIKYRPFDHSLLCARGLCKAYTGDKEGALVDMSLAIEYSKEKNFDNKIADMKAVLMSYDSAAEIYKNLYNSIDLDYYSNYKIRLRTGEFEYPVVHNTPNK